MECLTCSPDLILLRIRGPVMHREVFDASSELLSLDDIGILCRKSTSEDLVLAECFEPPTDQ